MDPQESANQEGHPGVMESGDARPSAALAPGLPDPVQLRDEQALPALVPEPTLAIVPRQDPQAPSPFSSPSSSPSSYSSSSSSSSPSSSSSSSSSSSPNVDYDPVKTTSSLAQSLTA